MASNLTTGSLLAEGLQRLAPATPAALLDAELLLAHVLTMSRARIRAHAEEARMPEERERYLALLARRAAGEPLAYIVGHKEFWSLRLAVSPAVLVPRPETELLVERALALRPEPGVTALDLGTGCGAIALALATERRDWRITATDASAAALALARRNSVELHLPIELLAGSWFEPLPGRRFQLVLSNPPYVGAGEAALASPPLSFEPHEALSPGPDALSSLRHIIRAAPEHLERGAWLLLEHGAEQAAQVARELVVRGFAHVRSCRDLAGHERMTEARWGS
jgi:release factor glutamine methyltransferase